jgi:endonuclease/exonuclease/phosphatase family metal-dependent hydrolase
VRFVSFNIHHGTVGRRGPVDPEQLGSVCAGFDADVLCLQEVDQGTVRVRGVDLAARVADACAMEHTFGTSQRLLGGRYGNAVLVRGEIRSSSVTRLPKVPRHRFWQEQRTLLGVDAVVDGHRLWVGCTHLAVKQWNNGPQLESLVAQVASIAEPKVVLGDLNRPLGAVAPLVGAGGLRAVDAGPTYPADAPRRAIDHVLVGAGWQVLGSEVRSTAMSDHAALIVDLGPPEPRRR